MLKRKRLLVGIFSQVLLIVFLVLVIFFRVELNSNSNYQKPISKDALFYSEKSTLKYFYEPISNSEDFDIPDWENEGGPINPRYQINSDGLNQLADFEVEKKEEVFRIMTLGDSLTFGRFVNTEDNYPSSLQEILNIQCKSDFQVLNLGVSGYDIQYVVERYRLRGKKYDPDLVIWLITEDDLLRLSEKLFPKAEKLLDEMKKNGEYQKSIENGDPWLYWKLARDEVIEEIGGVEELQKKQYKFLSDFRKLYSGKFVIVSTVNEKILVGTLEDFEKNNSDVYISKLDYNKIDLLPDGHPSVSGHNSLANEVFNYLKINSFVECN